MPAATDAPCSELPYTFCGTVPFDKPEHATYVKNALDVDPELRPNDVTRKLEVNGNNLVIEFAASELRMLRAAVGTFYDLLALATRALERFGPQGSVGGAAPPCAAAAAAAAVQQQ